MWYLVVNPGKRGQKIGANLIKKSIHILERDAKVLGYPSLKGVFGEVNSVEKMTPQQIEIDKKDSMDPGQREIFWEKAGFHIVGFNYVQPPCEAGMEPCFYLDLRCYPLDEQWKTHKSIPSNVMSIILYKFLKNGIVIPNLDKDPLSQRMLTEIKSKQNIPILM